MGDAYPGAATDTSRCDPRFAEPAPDLIRGLNPGYVIKPGLPATPTSFGMLGALGAIVFCALR